MNAEFSTDIEPSQEHGTYYLDITREQAWAFKNYQSLESDYFLQ